MGTKTRFAKILRGSAASAALLAILSGCGGTQTPLNATGKSSNNSNNGGYWNWGPPGPTAPTAPTGAATPTPSATPPADVPPAPPAVTMTTPWNSAQMALGYGHTCIVDKNTGAVWCAGSNSSGQLGVNDFSNRSSVVKNYSLTSGVKMIAAGGDTTCALDSNRGVWCWGSNSNGQLGNDSGGSSSAVPVRVSALTQGVKALAVGMSHACAIDSGDAIWCWGKNNYGQLGNNGNADSRVPVRVGGFSGAASALALGSSHSCATNTAGALYCWGFGDSGRLGVGGTANKALPTPVSGLNSLVLAVSAGYTHTCAVKTDNTLWCWGSNYLGQLANGSKGGGSETPVKVTRHGIQVRTLAAGGYHTCITDGGAYIQCWGDNPYGQVGNGTTTGQNSPVYVNETHPTIRVVASGGYHSCALSAIGMECWGYNGYGELANGDFTNRSVATGTNVGP